ncbi:hypothetical protein [Amycolatopsis cihanbeyliensis]|uniref:Uncharacterized protein n=1 Tax=Amycolatopsis cihanbeyliensis TaxID=1128664 RepID=A0A542DE80_AMYCI|nr:hypothetical protein [Amycolatopsis cihanbeyliensis]TQJ01387.1 hypothetical protein FB471_1065 [Amycolatopsis cihanbeyliensis]
MSAVVVTGPEVPDELIEVPLADSYGTVHATVPAWNVAGLLLHRRPRLERLQLGYQVRENSRIWLLCIPDHGYLPLECYSKAAATKAARAFRRDADDGAVTGCTSADLARWVRAWCSRNPDAVPLLGYD